MRCVALCVLLLGLGGRAATAQTIEFTGPPNYPPAVPPMDLAVPLGPVEPPFVPVDETREVMRVLDACRKSASRVSWSLTSNA